MCPDTVLRYAPIFMAIDTRAGTCSGSAVFLHCCFPALLSSYIMIPKNHSRQCRMSLFLPIRPFISPQAHSRFFNRTHYLRRSCGWHPVFSFCGTFPIMPQQPDFCRDTLESCREVPYKPVYFEESTTFPRSSGIYQTILFSQGICSYSTFIANPS